MGIKTNSNLEKAPCYHHTFDTCKISMANRRKTLKIGNAIRLTDLKEDTIFKDCRVFIEGSLTADGIEPYSKHKCFIYVNDGFNQAYDDNELHLK